VLSQVDNAQEVEVSGTTTTSEAGDGSGGEDETLVIVEGEDELKNQIKGLRKQLAESQRKTQSLEEKLLQRNSAMEVLKEESDGVLSCTQAELYEARQKVQKYEGEVVTAEQELARMRAEMKTIAEELHQGEACIRLEMEGTKLRLEEKTQQMTRIEGENATMRAGLDVAKEQIDQLVPETKNLKQNLALSHELNGTLEEQLDSLKKEVLVLKDELERVTTHNSQTLASLGIRTLERGEAHAFVTKSDLVSEAEVMKMLRELNGEIFEAGAYMADSFTFSPNPAMTNEVKGAYTKVTQWLGPTMALSLLSVRHDEDPLIVQIACQTCMVESCKRIMSSWCFDGSKAEAVLPDLYSRIQNTGKFIYLLLVTRQISGCSIQKPTPVLSREDGGR
jgi:hypothetical protein